MRLRPLRAASLLLFLQIPLAAAAADGKLDARARTALARLRSSAIPSAALRRSGASVAPDGALDVFIRGSVSRSELEAAGARVRTAMPGLFTASIPVSAVDRVAALTGVVAIRGGAPCQPELNTSVATTGAQYLRGAGPTFAGLNGQGVLVGIVDSGVDYGHADFKGSGRRARYIAVRDQVLG